MIYEKRTFKKLLLVVIGAIFGGFIAKKGGVRR
jgi:hypothetical protein